MVDVVRRFGFVASTTLPAEIVPVPVLAVAAAVRIGAAAAILPGSLISTPMPVGASRVGRVSKRSPTAAPLFTTIERPSALKGSAEVPVPVMVTVAPVAALRSDQVSVVVAGGAA